MTIALAPALLLALWLPGDLLLEETRLAALPEGVSLEGEPIVDPNGQRQPVVHRVVWSPDGRRVAYVGVKDGATHPVIDEVVLDAYDFLSSPSFSADGEHVVFRAGSRTSKSKELWAVLYDGQEVASEDWIGEVSIAPDGEALAYWIQPGARVGSSGAYDRGDQLFVLQELKGKTWKTRKSPKYDDASSLIRPLFSEDGDVAATACKDKNTWHVLRLERGKKKPELDGEFLGAWIEVALSPDGKHWAVTANTLEGMLEQYGQRGRGSAQRVLVDGKVVGRHYEAAGCAVFSPSRDRVAYKVLRDGRYGVAYDDREDVEPAYDFVYRPVFGPRGKRVAYVAVDGARPQPGFGLSSMAEWALEGGERFVVREELDRREPRRGAGWLEVEGLVFSPDGEHLAYAARAADGWRVVLDEAPGPLHEEVGAPRFAEDSQTLVYGARDGAELWWRVWRRADGPAEGE